MSPENASEKFKNDIHQLQDCLQSTHFLHRLKMPELEKLMNAVKKQHFPAGATIFKRGDRGEDFYLVAKGRLSYWMHKGLRDKKVADLYPRDYFGEGALVGDGKRSATIKAETDCDLFVIHQDDFRDTLMANPEIAQAIHYHILKRNQMKEQNTAPGQPVTH